VSGDNCAVRGILLARRHGGVYRVLVIPASGIFTTPVWGYF